MMNFAVLTDWTIFRRPLFIEPPGYIFAQGTRWDATNHKTKGITQEHTKKRAPTYQLIL